MSGSKGTTVKREEIQMMRDLAGDRLREGARRYDQDFA